MLGIVEEDEEEMKVARLRRAEPLARAAATRDKVLIDADRVREVPDASGYWRRRLRDGDVVIVEEEEQQQYQRAVPRHQEGAQ